MASLAEEISKFPDMSHLPPAVAVRVLALSKLVGLAPDQTRFLLCLLLSLALGSVHRLTPTATLRHVLSAGVGAFFCWFVSGTSGLLHPLLSSLACYIMVAALPPRRSPMIVFLFVMVYISCAHIYRMYDDYLGWSLDYTTAQMMVTVKASTFAYNYADGQLLRRGEPLSRPRGVKQAQHATAPAIGEDAGAGAAPSAAGPKPEVHDAVRTLDEMVPGERLLWTRLAQSLGEKKAMALAVDRLLWTYVAPGAHTGKHHEFNAKSIEQVERVIQGIKDAALRHAAHEVHSHLKSHKFRAERVIMKLPSVLEFYSYIFFYGGVLAGPCYEFREYVEFTDRTQFTPFKLRGPPGSLVPTLRCVALGVLFGGLNMLKNVFPIMGYMETEAFLLGTSLLYRFAYCFAAVTVNRFKYYFAWYLSEAGCLAAGFGFNGYQRDSNGAPTSAMRWDRVTNCDAFAVEFGNTMPQLTNHWNMGVNHWLKHYVYFRVDAGSAFANNLCTKLTSAVWHGFYPAYYLFFLSAAPLSVIDSGFRHLFRPWVYGKDDKPIASAPVVWLYNALAWLLLFLSMNYLGVAFALLRADWSLTVWRSLYFYAHVGMLVCIVLLRLVPAKKGKRE